MEEELHNQESEKEPETVNPESVEDKKETDIAPEETKEMEKETTEKKEKSFLGKKKQNADLNKLQQQNEMLKNEIDEWKDKYTRLAAEYDNYRKRTLKEIDMRYDDAKVDVWKNIIGIIDDFERALQAEILPECQNYKDGVQLIYKKLWDIMDTEN